MSAYLKDSEKGGIISAFYDGNIGKPLFYWKVLLQENVERNHNWYMAVGFLSLVMIGFSLFSSTKNYIFALIIILFTIILVLQYNRGEERVVFVIGDKGIGIGKKWYDYEELKHFAIVHKPEDNVKNLYFDFQQTFKHQLSIPLYDNDPAQIRETLLKYLKEDIKRVDEPMSEKIARALKL